MPLIVEQTDPREPQATALLKASHALMQALFNPEENHFLGIDALCGDDVHFFTARQGETVIATGALALRGTDAAPYGEVKSMFTTDAARGKGAASAILRAIEDLARDLNLPVLNLETGDTLHAAHRLYTRHGFETCAPFGNYTAMPTSLFMTKPLLD
ncbi:GNAT family N-acetyltransferase [Rhodobacterales bacterium 59_46_T64]|nr:GNAT family N-acetyltransferase [Rhodobacterales bacterium 59_46_T64]